MKAAIPTPHFRTKSLAFVAESISDEGVFEGYASVFETVDTYREKVIAGAFIESIAEIAAGGYPLPMLWQHDQKNPIGSYDVLREDSKGLYCRGNLLMELGAARDAHVLMKARVVRGLSIGYWTIEDSFDEKERIRSLKKLELIEISPVTFGANPDALIDDVKMRLARGERMFTRDVETILKSIGFSNSRAAKVANSGLPSLYQGEPGGDEKGEVVQMLRRIALPAFTS
jgi:HK97 family phage prohead protease